MEFPKGLIIKSPGSAPDFVKAKISIKVDEMINWLSEQNQEWINLDVKSSKYDPSKWYASVNEWVPNGPQPDPSPRTDAINADDYSDIDF